MGHRIAALVFAGLIAMAAPASVHPVAAVEPSAATPAVAQPGEPRAAAWAVHLSLPSAGQVLQIGDVTAASGSRPMATAAAVLINGQGTGTVVADAAHGDVVKDAQSFSDPPAPFCPPPLEIPGRDPIGLCDPGGNMHLRGGFAEAHVSGGSSSSQAGIGSGNGNGFAFASKNFSFADQSTALNAIQTLDDTIFGPINSLLDQTLSSVTNVVNAPHLEGIPPAGLIDILDSGALTGSSQTSASPGFNSAKADGEIGTLKLLGGFIELHNVKASADSESNSGSDSRSASATVGGITIAGLNVVADSNGFKVVETTANQVLQQAFDTMIAALQQAGLTIRAAETKEMNDLREATAFGLTWTTPNGVIDISIGHAEASAASVGAPVEIPPSTNFGPPPSGPITTPPTVAAVPPLGGPTGPVPSVGGTTTTRSGPIVRSLGPAAARAIRTAYLIFLVTGFVASLGYPMFVRRHWSRRRVLA